MTKPTTASTVKKGFIMYVDFKAQIEKLSMSQRGELLTCIYSYQSSGSYDSKDPVVDFAMAGLIAQFDRDKDKYHEKCHKNSDNAKKRWDANACERIRTDANHADSDSDSDKDTDKDSDIKPTKKFVKPTLEEISSYIQERVSGGKPFVDSEKFFDHYEAVGWKVGRSAMKDWKAAVRTWEKNNSFVYKQSPSRKEVFFT